MAKAKRARKTLTGRLKELEERANLNFYEIQRSLDTLLRFEDRAKAGFLHAEKRIVELEHATTAKVPPKFETRLEEFKAGLEDRLKSVEDIIMLLELELVKTKEKTAIVPGVPTDLEDRMRVLEEKTTKIETLKIGVPAELAEHEPRMRSIEDNLLSLEARLKQETDRLERQMSEKAITEKTAGELAAKLHAEIADIRRGIDKAELLKTEILTKEKDFARKSEFEKFTDFTHGEVEKLRHLVDRVTAIETSLDRRLIDIEEKLRDDVESHKRAFDTQLIQVEEKLTSAIKSESSEVRALLDKAGRMERDIEARTTGIVSKELAEFSHILDSKFPGMVSQRDFEEFEAEIRQRVAAIEAPDISHVESRLDNLESRVRELTALAKIINERMPLVVE